MKKLIYKNTDHIEYVTMKANNVIKTLNENHKKVTNYNKLLTPKITLLQSLYNYGYTSQLNDEIREKTIEELRKIIKEKSPFYSEEMVMEFYTKMMMKLHGNHLVTINGITKFKDNVEMYEKQNITHLSNNMPYMYDGYYPDVFALVKDLIVYDESKSTFSINEKNYKKFVDSQTHYTKNKKQEKVMEQLEIINSAFQEINKVTNNISHLLYLTAGNKIVMNVQNCNRIEEIK